MNKKHQVPSAIAKISILYVAPTVIASSSCPHCAEINFLQVDADQKGQSILHCCAVCDCDYCVELPELPTSKIDIDYAYNQSPNRG